MPSYNGFLNTVRRTITHKGDLAWSDLTTWSAYTSWVTYTSTTAQAATGALGSALKYSTDIVDLGESKDFYIETTHSGDGSIRPVIEYSTSDATLSSPSFIGKYTDNNEPDGTPETHTVLNYYEEGYSDEDDDTVSGQAFRPITARYVRVNAFVENFATATTRGVSKLYNFNWRFRTEEATEKLRDVAVSGNAHSLGFNNIQFLTDVQITAQSETDKKLIGQIVSKASKTIRVVDANSFSVDGVAATVDVDARGFVLITNTIGGAVPKA